MAEKGKAPVFCEKYCVVCKGARAGNSICKAIQNLELKIFGKTGCIWGKARTKFYGVTPDQKIPEKAKNNPMHFVFQNICGCRDSNPGSRLGKPRS